MVKGHFATKSFRPLDVSAPRHFGPRLFLCTSHSKTGQGVTMAETLIIILTEHNVPINFADHFINRVSRSLKKGQRGIQKKGTWCALSHSKRAHSVRARYG